MMRSTDISAVHHCNDKPALLQESPGLSSYLVESMAVMTMLPGLPACDLLCWTHLPTPETDERHTWWAAPTSRENNGPLCCVPDLFCVKRQATRTCTSVLHLPSPDSFALPAGMASVGKSAFSRPFVPGHSPVAQAAGWRYPLYARLHTGVPLLCRSASS
jgi:hypothetical protein